MRSSSPNHPSTPCLPSRRYPSLSISTHQPLQSSPLASPSSKSSPISTVQRRKSGYKAAFPLLFSNSADSRPAEEPQKAFLRERFKARCFARAKKDREKAWSRANRNSTGSVSGGSSDGDGDFEMDDDDGEDVEGEDATMQEEVRFLHPNPPLSCRFRDNTMLNV